MTKGVATRQIDGFRQPDSRIDPERVERVEGS